MGLHSHGKEWIKGSGGDHVHKRYYFHLGFFCKNMTLLEEDPPETYYQLSDLFSAVDIEDNANFDVIVGMNILRHCDLEFKRNGDFKVIIPA